VVTRDVITRDFMKYVHDDPAAPHHDSFTLFYPRVHPFIFTVIMCESLHSFLQQQNMTA